MITITLTATPARKEVLLLLPEFRNRDFSAPTAWKREGVAFVAAECLDGRIGPLAACRAPALPRFLYGGARIGIPRGGSDFRHRRQILGQDTYLMGDCERSERLELAAGEEIFFENDVFKEKIY